MTCPQIGTRIRMSTHRGRLGQGSDTRSHTRDVGMSKRIVKTLTFAAGTGRVTGANNDFAAFRPGDPILVQGTRLNNGLFEIAATDAVNSAFLRLDPPPKDEAGVANTIIRTP